LFRGDYIALPVHVVELELDLDLLLEELVFSLLDRIVLVVVAKEALIRRVGDPTQFTIKVGLHPEVVVHLAKHVLVEALVQLGVGDEFAFASLVIELLLELDVELVVE